MDSYLGTGDTRLYQVPSLFLQNRLDFSLFPRHEGFNKVWSFQTSSLCYNARDISHSDKVYKNWSRFGVITFRVKPPKTVAFLDGMGLDSTIKGRNTATTLEVSDSMRVDQGGHSFTLYRTVINLS